MTVAAVRIERALRLGDLEIRYTGCCLFVSSSGRHTVEVWIRTIGIISRHPLSLLSPWLAHAQELQLNLNDAMLSLMIDYSHRTAYDRELFRCRPCRRVCRFYF